jgi:hypothetical protein
VPNFFCALVIYSFTGTSKKQLSKISSTIGLPNLDPEGLFGFGLLGLWLGTVILIMFKANLIPKRLAILGLLGALFNELVFVGTLFHIALLIDLAVGVGGMIVGPVLLIGLGVRLLRRGM